MVALSQATLEQLPQSVPVPRYDRREVRSGIVHFGVGGFHRAHQAVYLDSLMNEGKAHDYGICGVGLLPGDAAMRDALKAQDCLYTVVVKYPDGTLQPRVIGSIVDYLFAPDDPEAVLGKLAAPETRLVTLTVTEGGYNINQVTGEFDVDDPAVQADMRPGAVPRTVFGFVVEGLRRRRELGLPPLTVVSCDNIQGNGEVARRAFSTFASLMDEELGRWVEESVRFPNSMVDRITPVTSQEDRQVLGEQFGIEDRWPVVCEPYIQWVLEDAFTGERPPLEHVAVQVVDDVHPYELIKLRLLNAGHHALAYLGYLDGYRYAHEVAHDPLYVTFLLGYMTEEASPTVQPVPGLDLSDYRRTLVERFANPSVKDTLARLCADTSDRIPKFLVPVIRYQLDAGGPIERSALVVASWVRYAEGVDEQGERIDVVDRLADRLVPLARRSHEEPTAFISDRELFGDLVDDERFVSTYVRLLSSLHERGARATLEDVVASLQSAGSAR